MSIFLWNWKPFFSSVSRPHGFIPVCIVCGKRRRVKYVKKNTCSRFKAFEGYLCRKCRKKYNS